MLTNVHNLLGLPVFTKSGVKLGKVAELKIDVESHCILQYEVKGGMLSKTDLLVKTSQVLAIEKDKMIVDDNLAEQTKKESKANLNVGEVWGGALGRSLD